MAPGGQDTGHADAVPDLGTEGYAGSSADHLLHLYRRRFLRSAAGDESDRSRNGPAGPAATGLEHHHPAHRHVPVLPLRFRVRNG